MTLLKGLCLISLSSVGPAARAAQMLADYGMHVIKVAPVSAKGGKQIEPDYYAYGAGRGMQKIRIDLTMEQGKAVLAKLASASDAFMEAYRPGVAERLGIGYSDLQRVKNDIVYCSVSGYGQVGPYSQWAGHDINYLAVSGYLACSGQDFAGLPAMAGATVADSAGGGMHAVMAIISALLNRERTGKGAYLDVSATDGMLSLMSLYLDKYTATGVETRSNEGVLTGAYAWYNLYFTRDGGAVSVGAIEPKFYRNLCRLLDLEQFMDSQYDLKRQPEIKVAFREKFLTCSRDDWIDYLSSHDACVAPVLNIPEVTENEHFNSRKSFMRARHPSDGEFTQLGPVLAGSDRHQPLFELREHGSTDAVSILQSAGFSEDYIRGLTSSGCVE